jgi:large subunit ribosomal protein L14
MKAIKAKIPRALPTGAYINCADNTGARILNIMAVKGYRGTKGRNPAAGIGDLITASVKKGTPELRKQIVHAVVIRQKKEFRRPSGIRVEFEDNAAVLTDEKGEPKGTEIKGPLAQEVIERYSKIATLAAIIV